MPRRRVDVALLYEKAVRELDVACAIKHILERRHGLTTEIIQQTYPEPWVLRDLDPKVVALPFCYQQRSNNAYLVRWQDSVFFNLTWEQLFYRGNATAKTPRGTFATKHVIHNAWSEDYVGLLRNQRVPVEHIFRSGNPAYTLYDAPYRSYFKTRSQLAADHGLDAARPWMFFPENYNWAFYEPAMLEQMVRDGQSRSQVDAMREAVTRSFQEAMRWTARVADTEKVHVIVRPRPSTPLTVFRSRVLEVIGQLPARMAILAADSVRDWILASDVVVSSYSTSVIEAGVAGKATYFVEPSAWPSDLYQPWHDLVPRLATEKDFIDVALAGGQATDAARLRAWARETLMSRGDSILLIADEMARVVRGERPIPAAAPWQAVFLAGRRRLPAWPIHLYRRHLKPYLPAPAIPVEEEYVPDVAAMASIPDRVNRWRVILDPYLAGLGPYRPSAPAVRPEGQ